MRASLIILAEKPRPQRRMLETICLLQRRVRTEEAAAFRPPNGMTFGEGTSSPGRQPGYRYGTIVPNHSQPASSSLPGSELEEAFVHRTAPKHIQVFLLFCLISMVKLLAAQATGDESKIKDLLSRLTLQEEIRLLSGSNLMATTPIERLHIPAFRMSDGPMGAHIPAPSTAYSAGIGLAASWDRDLARQIGTQIGRDARSRGVAFLLGPGVNIYR